MLRNLQRLSRGIVAELVNDSAPSLWQIVAMEKIVQIHYTKQPRRPHYIPDWAKKRGLSQAKIAREIGADKSLITRWYQGSCPKPDYQERLAALFSIEPEDLFRSPEDNWLKRFFQERRELFDILQARSPDELDRIKGMIEAAFPQRKQGTGTGG